MRRFLGRRLGGLLIGALLLTLVWNWLVPPLFGGPLITYLQALGLMALGRLLTGGMHQPACRHRPGPWREGFRRKMEEKMAGMTPEERERFREGFAGGRWDVNIFEVEDEAPEKPADEEEGGEGDKPDGPAQT